MRDQVIDFKDIDYILVYHPDDITKVGLNPIISRKFVLYKFDIDSIDKNKTYYYLFNIENIPKTTIISSDDYFHFENIYLNNSGIKNNLIDLSIMKPKLANTKFHLLDYVFDPDFGFGKIVGLNLEDEQNCPYIVIQVKFDIYVYRVLYYGNGDRITANENNDKLNALKLICRYEDRV